MATDPRATIEDIVDGISTTIDDDATAASLCFRYSDGSSTLKELFNTDDYDAMISIGEPQGRHTRPIQEEPVFHNFDYPIVVQTINKYDSSSVLISTGPELQYKIRDALYDEMESGVNRFGAGGGKSWSIVNESMSPLVRRVGGMRVWEMTYTFKFKESQ